MKKLSVLLTLLLCLAACGEQEVQPSAAEVLPEAPAFDLMEYENGAKLARYDENGEFAYRVYVDHVTITAYLGNSETVEIPAEIDGVPVTVLSGMLSSPSGITGITLPEGLLAITDLGGFYNCADLTEIQLPKSLKYLSLDAIGTGGGLTSLTLPASLETLVARSPYSELRVPEILVEAGSTHFSSVDGVLFDAAGQTLLYYPPDREGSYRVPDTVTKIGASAFMGSRLSEVVLPEGLQEIEGYAFVFCDRLETIELPKSLTHLGDSVFAMEPGARLEAIHVAQGNPSYISVDGVLYNKDMTELLCYPLGKRDTEFTIPDGVETGWEGPLYSPYIKTLTIPAGVRGTCYYFGDSLGPEEIYYQGTAKEWLCLCQCYGFSSPTVHIAELDTPAANRIVSGDYAYTATDGQATICGYLGGETVLTIPDTLDGLRVAAIGDGAFCFQGTVKEICLPQSVTSIGKQAFFGSAIQKIDIPASVTVIGDEALSFCARLTEITVAQGNPSYASIDGVLYTADGATLIRIPCKKGAAWSETVVETGGEQSVIQDTVDEGDSSYILPAAVTEIYPDAFLGCRQLDAIGVEAGNTAFAAVDGVLTTIDGKTLVAYPAGAMARQIPDTVTTAGQWSLACCSMADRTDHLLRNIKELEPGVLAWSSLRSITVPTQVTEIPADAFLGSGMEQLVLPAGVASIGKDAFLHCDNLSVIHYGGTEAQWQAISVEPGNDVLEFVVIDFESDGSESD